MRQPALAIIVLLAAGCAANATELVVRNIGLAIETLPTDFSYELKDDIGTRSGDDAFDSSYGLAIGGAYSFCGPGRSHGVIGSADLTYATYGYASSGSMNDIGARIGGGYGYAFNDRWTFDAMALIAGGMSTFDMPATDAFPEFKSSGIFIGYGADVGAAFTITEHIIAKLSVGYMQTSHALTVSDENIDLTLDTSGFHVLLGVYWKFTTLPWRLE